jgi:hypothetical protein
MSDSGTCLDDRAFSRQAYWIVSDGGGVRRQPRSHSLAANDSYDAAPMGAVGVHVSSPAHSQEKPA